MKFRDRPKSRCGIRTSSQMVMMLVCGLIAFSQPANADDSQAVGEAPFVDRLPDSVRRDVLFFADHERGDLSEWHENGKAHPGGGVFLTGPEGEATAVITSELAFSGRYSVNARIENAFRGRNDVRAVRLMRWTDLPWDAGGDYFPQDAYYSTWMFVPEKYNSNKRAPWDPGDGGWWNVFQFKSHDDQNVSQPAWSVNLYFDEQRSAMEFGLYSQLNQTASVEQSDPIAVPVGRWFHLEARYRVSTQPLGAIEVWQDGNLILSAKNVVTSISPKRDWAVWGIGNYTDHVAGGRVPGTATLLFDDAIVSRSPIHPWIDTGDGKSKRSDWNHSVGADQRSEVK